MDNYIYQPKTNLKKIKHNTYIRKLKDLLVSSEKLINQNKIKEDKIKEEIKEDKIKEEIKQNKIKEEIKEDNLWFDIFEDVMATNKKIGTLSNMGDITNILDNMSDISLEKIAVLEETMDYELCPICKIHCKVNDTMIICESCGLEREWNLHVTDGYSMTIDQNYNTSSNSFNAFNVVGNGAYCYQRSRLKTCADSTQYRTNNNKKEITNFVYQYEGHKPPQNVINTASELFDQILKKGYKYRENKRRGIFGACLYYACIMHNLTRAPKEIVAIMRTEERFLSQGDKLLQELNEYGIISIPTNHEPLSDYINQYFPSLGIPMKYKKFIIDLIARAEIKHLHIENESRTTSKCIGAIYLLTKRVPELSHIKKEDITRECGNISKSTFIRYYQLIMNSGRLLKKIFKRHSIKMPTEWRKLK